MIRIKMICNWTNSKNLCDEWSNMCEKNYKWKNLEITWEDNDIDYYVIINYPKNDDFFIPSKTIIFQMEPECAINCWGKWANPDEKKFLFVGKHKNSLNAVQLQIKTIPNHYPIMRYERIITILSHKNHDIGHKLRINFIKNLEKQHIDILDIYGRENYHDFINYMGKVIDNDKEKCFVKYKYCFQAENNFEYNYATEKIWEPIVCEMLTFYWGCPNLEDYLNPNCFVRLDLNNYEESIKIIETAIKEDWWSQRIDIIRNEKKKIIEDLGFFPTLDKIINNHNNSEFKNLTNIE
jgi:hypothetical protein